MEVTELTESQIQAVAETKAMAQRVKNSLPESMLKGKASRQSHHKSTTSSDREIETAKQIEATYNQLEGEWRDWLDVARKYEKKIPTQDQLDVRHDIMIRLATVRKRSGEPIPIYKAYRVASYTVADYYRLKAKLTTSLDCKHCPTAKRRECVKYSLYSQCPKVRPVVSLDAEHINGTGESFTLLDVLADDTAIDLDQWLDVNTWLHGCPKRLISIAVKIASGKTLDGKDRKYLWKFRKHTQKPMF